MKTSDSKLILWPKQLAQKSSLRCTDIMQCPLVDGWPLLNAQFVNVDFSTKSWLVLAAFWIAAAAVYSTIFVDILKETQRMLTALILAGFPQYCLYVGFLQKRKEERGKRRTERRSECSRQMLDKVDKKLLP